MPKSHYQSWLSHSWFRANKVFCVLGTELPDAVIKIPLTHCMKAWCFCAASRVSRSRRPSLWRSKKGSSTMLSNSLTKTIPGAVLVKRKWVVCFHKHLSSLITNQLGDIHIALWCARPHSLADVFEAGNWCSVEPLLKQPKTPVWCKLRVASNQKIEGQTVMKTHHALPSQVPKHELFLVLSRAVVTVQLDMFLPKSMMGEEMVQVWEACIGAFADAVSLIDQVVDLLRHTFTANSKHTLLVGNQKVHWSRLDWVTGVMNL